MTNGGVAGKSISDGLVREYGTDRLVASSRDTVARERMFSPINMCTRGWHFQSELVPPSRGLEALSLGLHPKEAKAYEAHRQSPSRDCVRVTGPKRQ